MKKYLIVLILFWWTMELEGQSISPFIYALPSSYNNFSVVNGSNESKNPHLFFQ